MFKNVAETLQKPYEKPMKTVEVNPFADILDMPEEPPKREKTKQMEDWKLSLPVYNKMLPPRPGPTLWWEKDKNNLDPETIWHRTYRMSPEHGVHGEEVKRGAGVQRYQPSNKGNWYGIDE